MNSWKIASICMIALIFILSFNLYFNTTKYKFGNNLEINKNIIGEISETVGDYFTLCNLKTYDCVKIRKIGENGNN